MPARLLLLTKDICTADGSLAAPQNGRYQGDKPDTAHTPLACVAGNGLTHRNKFPEMSGPVAKGIRDQAKVGENVENHAVEGNAVSIASGARALFAEELMPLRDWCPPPLWWKGVEKFVQTCEPVRGAQSFGLSVEVPSQNRFLS